MGKGREAAMQIESETGTQQEATSPTGGARKRRSDGQIRFAKVKSEMKAIVRYTACGW